MHIRTLVAGSLLGGLFFAAPLALAQAASISVAAPSPSPFSTITVAGSGFSPHESVHVMLGLSTTDVSTNGAGSFSGASLTIPNVAAGTYLVLALGQTSGVSAYSYLYVSALAPQASPSSWYVAPGSSVTWSGSGFAPNEKITVTQGGATAATFSADGSGAFANAGSTLIPLSLRNSSVTVALDGALSHAHLTYPIGVSDLYPYVTPSTWYTLPGTPLTFSGAGFGASEGVSVFLLGSSTPLAHTTTDLFGAFRTLGPLTIPYLSASTATFRIVGDASGAAASTPITLAQFYPTLTPSAYYAAPGSYISLDGSGFAPHESVDIAAGHTHWSATTNGSGAFNLPSVHMPTTPNTMLTLRATGSLSNATTNVTIAIGSYYAWMTISTYWAQGGTPLVVFGHNFAAGELVSITSGGTTLGSATAGNDGSFTAPLAVPFVPPGPATITATGADSGASASSDMTVAPVYTDLQLGAYASAPGTHIRFIGHGYLPNEPITVTTDRTGTTKVATFAADASGSFDYASYAIPLSFSGGPLVLTVTGGHSFDSKHITYYVTGA